MGDKLLDQAVHCDQLGRKFEALTIYEHLIAKLMQKMSAISYNSKHLMQLTANYIERAEVVKQFLEKKFAPKKRIKTKLLMDDADGAGFKELFSPYLKSKVTEVEVIEANMNEAMHYKNLTDFLTMLADSCPKLKYIRFVSRLDESPQSTQKRALIKVKNCMLKRDIDMGIKYTVEDVESKVILNNGYIIKTGVGLHYHKPTYKKNGVLMDRNACKCISTAFEVWRAAGF